MQLWHACLKKRNNLEYDINLGDATTRYDVTDGNIEFFPKHKNEPCNHKHIS